MVTTRNIASLSTWFALSCVCVSLCSCRTFVGHGGRTREVPAATGTMRIEAEPKHHVGLVSDEQPIAERRAPQPPRTTAAVYNTPLPRPAWTATQAGHHAGGCGCNSCGPGSTPTFRFSREADPNEPWAPEGIARPWPRDEYIWDGGDRNQDFRVTNQQRAYGLDLEDTVAHYKGEHDCPETAHSNRVPIYAPRFAAVRHVSEAIGNDQTEKLGQAADTLRLINERDLRVVTQMNQPVAPIGGIAIDQSLQLKDRTAGLTAEHTLHLLETKLKQLPQEFRDLLGPKILTNTEKLRLAQLHQAASEWTIKQTVVMIVDEVMPIEFVGNETPGATIAYDRKGCPQIRLIKIADKSEANPGEIVTFTIRFDNVGSQKVRELALLDNLTTRLEYVEGSQDCSHKCDFGTEANEGGALVLKWRITDDLRSGEGGIIKFQCRVR